MLWPRGETRDEALLLGVLSSIPLDWYTRRFVETHVRFFVFTPLPVSRPGSTDPRWLRVVELAARLASADTRLSDWSRFVGVECGPLCYDVKQKMIQVLDADVALLYNLDEEHLVHSFETFRGGWDFEPRLTATVTHFRRMAPAR